MILNKNIFQSIKNVFPENFTLTTTKENGTLTPNGSFSMGMIQKVGTSFNHVGGFQ